MHEHGKKFELDLELWGTLEKAKNDEQAEVNISHCLSMLIGKSYCHTVKFRISAPIPYQNFR